MHARCLQVAGWRRWARPGLAAKATAGNGGSDRAHGCLPLTVSQWRRVSSASTAAATTAAGHCVAMPSCSSGWDRTVTLAAGIWGGRKGARCFSGGARVSMFDSSCRRRWAPDHARGCSAAHLQHRGRRQQLLLTHAAQAVGVAWEGGGQQALSARMVERRQHSRQHSRAAAPRCEPALRARPPFERHSSATLAPALAKCAIAGAKNMASSSGCAVTSSSDGGPARVHVGAMRERAAAGGRRGGRRAAAVRLGRRLLLVGVGVNARSSRIRMRDLETATA